MRDMTRILLVKKILEQAHAFEWSLQGLGMFRMYLSKEVRMHVWDPRFAVEGVSRIHNHPWNFTSEVVRGWVVDELWRVLPREDLPCRKACNFLQQRITCGPHGGADGEPKEVSLAFRGARRHEAGTSYSLESDETHQTIADPGTITIVTRVFKSNTEHAFVYHKVGTPWVPATPRPATKYEVEAMRILALEKIG